MPRDHSQFVFSNVVLLASVIFHVHCFGQSKADQLFQDAHIRRTIPLTIPVQKDWKTASIKTFPLQVEKALYTVFLEPQPSVFHPDTTVQVVSNGHIRSMAHASKYVDQFYVGGLDKDPETTVLGSFYKGVFEGVITMANVSLYIEASARYHSNDSALHNAMGYWSNDLQPCSAKTLEHCRLPVGALRHHRARRPPHWLPLMANRAWRSKRHLAMDSVIHVCNLSVVVDHLYFTHVSGGDHHEAVREVHKVAFYADMVFRHADLDQDGHSDLFGFRVAELTILETPSAAENYTSSEAFVVHKWVPEALFKEMLANQKHFWDHCAGLFFTYRLMDRSDDQGITQLKVNFRTDFYSRGFCSKPREVWPPQHPVPDYTRYLFNALPVNFYHRGDRASRALGISATVHQLGHLFHAADDDDTEACRSRGNRAGFFMGNPIPEHSSGVRFSPCSLNDMNCAIAKKRRSNVYCIYGCRLAAGSNGEPSCSGMDFGGRFHRGPTLGLLTTTTGRTTRGTTKPGEDDYDNGGATASVHFDRNFTWRRTPLATILAILGRNLVLSWTHLILN